MSVSSFCIQRPVFTIVINAVVVLVGLWSGLGMQVRQLPKLVTPTVSVSAAFPGASADLVEREITSPLEQALDAVPGVVSMSSTSRQGLSAIQLTFAESVDPQGAVSDVRAKVAEVQATLPQGTRAPIVSQASADAQPVLYLSVSDAKRDPMEVTETVRRVMVPMLAAIPGVAQSQLIGERKYAIRIQLDPLRMAALGVTSDDVSRALSTQNLDVPGGQLRSVNQLLPVLVSTALNRPDQFDQLVLRRGDDGFQVRVGDVGTAVVGSSNAVNAIRFGGKTAVAIGIIAQSDANPLDIGRAVRDLLPRLQTAAPPGTEVAVAFDPTVFLQASVDEVFKAVVIAVVLVLAVVVFFLGSARSSAIALVTIPISLIGAFAVMRGFGFSINIFTMLAMILAVGLVVDDAIVEVENVQRLIDEGMDPMAATFRGSEEIGFAVIATTITLASVFAPVGLAGGVVGQLFKEFAFTLAATILLSGFVARTLSPMMCGRMIRQKPPGGWASKVDRVLAWLGRHYRTALRGILHARWLAGLATILCIVGTGFVASGLPGEMAPQEDAAYTLLKFEGPTTASLDYLTPWARAAEATFKADPDVASALVLLGTPAPNQVLAFVVFHDWSQRHRTSTQITASLMAQLAHLPGVVPSVFAVGGLGGGPPGQAVQVALRTNGDYEMLAQAVTAIRAAADHQAKLSTNLTSNLTMDTPTLVVDVNRLLAADLGVQISAVGGTIQSLLGGNRASTFSYRNSVYDVIVELPSSLRTDARGIDSIYVRGNTEKQIPLSAIIQVHEVAGPAVLSHTNGMRSATIGADLRPGGDAGAATSELLRIAQAAAPAAVKVETTGNSSADAAGLQSLGTVFLLALIFIYLVLSAQFESFRDPAIVLLAVPLAICGALVGLRVMGGSLNLYSVIGIVTLVGLIAKHGILITEFANQLRDEGMPFEEALLEAATQRLRPILMTTIATILGAAPLVIASGAGAASRAQIGMVISAGLGFGTLVSLFMIPVAYSLLSGRVRAPLPQPPAAHMQPSQAAALKSAPAMKAGLPAE
jgi:multidrug efflux pump